VEKFLLTIISYVFSAFKDIRLFSDHTCILSTSTSAWDVSPLSFSGTSNVITCAISVLNTLLSYDLVIMSVNEIGLIVDYESLR
jgi:hypothetical protein